jgi:glycosyltransferase involved in cell wall biosynthesis
MKELRVTQLTTSYPRFPGDGTAPFIHSIAETLQCLGVDVQVVAPYDPAVKPNPADTVEVTRFRYAPFASWHIMGHARALKADVQLDARAFLLLPFFLIEAARSLVRTARRQKANLIHAHWVIPNGIPAALVARRLGLPLVVSLHGSDMYVAGKNFLFRAVARWVFGQAALVTACSPDLKAEADALGAAGKSMLLPYGIFPEDYSVPYLVRSDDHYQIASLGRMVYKKGFRYLIEAFPAVLRAYPNSRLVIGGEGPVQPELAALAEALGVADQVDLPGRVNWDRLNEFMDSADLFILPSVKDQKGNMDGLPNVLLEALACRRPVIASQIGGVALVIRDGENGWLVPPADPQALADTICRALANPGQRAAVAAAGRETTETAFHWRTVVGKLLVELRRVVRHE